MTDSIRVLRVVALMNRGGVETQLMNIYRNIDKDKVQFDFLVTKGEQGVFDDEIRSLGGKIYYLPKLSEVGILKYIQSIFTFFRDHHYSIVHSHVNAMSGLFLTIAKYYNVPVRISQSHSAPDKSFKNFFVSIVEKTIKNFMKFLVRKNATHYWAVGHKAGRWLFGNNDYTLVPNSKSAKLLEYDTEKRLAKRSELEIPEDSYVLGHVGNFSNVKNHKFLIEVFYEFQKDYPNSYLCLVGDGPLRDELEQQINQLNISEHVLILGVRNDVYDLLNIFDLFVFPSFYEGMPNVIIEAQANSLPSLISDGISREIDFNLNLVNFLSLDKSANEWAQKAEDLINSERNIVSNFPDEYNLEKQVQWIENYYNDLFPSRLEGEL
ncbi:glycosyltransferase family 1 protein [Aerococcaceae bacterium DSM 111020]|nr:glycosyltransferase family 1 protein [Aerococcaceae bacterium DSM 111020]